MGAGRVAKDSIYTLNGKAEQYASRGLQRCERWNPCAVSSVFCLMPHARKDLHMPAIKPLNFGIEEEYFLSDLTSRELARQPSTAFLPACREALPEMVAAEMFVSQIELVTPILSSQDEARNCLAHARTTLSWLGEEHGLGIVAAGTHPLAQWRQQHGTDLPHYHDLFNDMQMVAQRSVLSGLHVHVGVPGDRIVVMNRVVQWLPLLLALSASSPFWGGRICGLHSYRQAACDEWPRMGMPEHFASQQDYERYVDDLMASGSIRSRSDVWWNIRPALQFPTLELRITDACPHLEDALCIAGLFRAMVTYAVHNPTPGPAETAEQRQLLKENRWRAKRFGIHGEYIEPGTRRSISLENWLANTWAVIGDYARAGGDESVYARALHILRNGNSASQQLQRYQAAIQRGASPLEALTGVVDQLRNQTLTV